MATVMTQFDDIISLAKISAYCLETLLAYLYDNKDDMYKVL